MLARTPQDEQQAMHVIDYRCAAALKHMRDIGACSRKADRKLTDYEFDYEQESLQNGEGGIF